MLDMQTYGVAFGQVHVFLALSLAAQTQLDRSVLVLDQDPHARASTGSENRIRSGADFRRQMEIEQGEVDSLSRAHLDQPWAGLRPWVGRFL